MNAVSHRKEKRKGTKRFQCEHTHTHPITRAGVKTAIPTARSAKSCSQHLYNSPCLMTSHNTTSRVRPPQQLTPRMPLPNKRELIHETTSGMVWQVVLMRDQSSHSKPQLIVWPYTQTLKRKILLNGLSWRLTSILPTEIIDVALSVGCVGCFPPGPLMSPLGLADLYFAKCSFKHASFVCGMVCRCFFTPLFAI